MTAKTKTTAGDPYGIACLRPANQIQQLLTQAIGRLTVAERIAADIHAATGQSETSQRRELAAKKRRGR